jgi:hypothetical protein
VSRTDAVTIVVLGVIGLSYLLLLVGLVLVGRASLNLRSRIGTQYSYRKLLAVMAFAAVPGRLWHRDVDPDSFKHIEVFRRRIWIALALIGTPLYVALVVQLL